MFRRRVIYLLLCLIVVGCGSSNSNVTGTWTYDATSTQGFGSTTGSLTLAQSGNAVTGTLSESNGNSYAVSGSVSGKNVFLQIAIICSGGTGTTALTGAVSTGTAMFGTYAEGDTCATDSGNWTAGRP